MRTEEQIEQFIAHTDEKITELLRREKRLRKDKSARGKLALVDVRLTLVEQRDSRISLEHEAVVAKVARLTEAVGEAEKSEGIATDGSASLGSETAKAISELKAAEAELHSNAWGGRRRGLLETKYELQGERNRAATESFDDIDAELREEADRIRADLDAAISEIASIRDRWDANAGAYLQLEQAIGGQQVRGRLDVPSFPVQITGDGRPVPAVLEENRDPTTTTDRIAA